MKQVIIIVAVVVILGAGAFYFFNNDAVAPTLNDTDENAAAPKGLVVKDSLFSWLKKDKGVECAINAEEGDITVYALGDKVRMEGVSMLPEKNDAESSTFLSDGEYIYIWNGKEGIKMSAEGPKDVSGQEPANKTEETNQYSWENMAQEWDKAKVKYDCQEKKLSSSLFTPPDDVAFVDMASMTGAAGINNPVGTNTEAEKAQNSGPNIDKEAMQKMTEEMGGKETE